MKNAVSTQVKVERKICRTRTFGKFPWGICVSDLFCVIFRNPCDVYLQLFRRMVSFKLRKTEGTGKRRERWEGTAGKLALGPSYASTWLASSTCLSYSPLAFGVALGGGFAWAGGWLPVNLYRLCGENVPIALWNFCEQKCGFPVVHFWPGCCFSFRVLAHGLGFLVLSFLLWGNDLAWKNKRFSVMPWRWSSHTIKVTGPNKGKDGNHGISAC